MKLFSLVRTMGFLMLGSTTPAFAQFEGFVDHGLVGVGRLPSDSFDALGPSIDTLGGVFSGLFFDATTWRREGDPGKGFIYSGILYGLADRGFGDGAQDFHPRIQVFQMSVSPYAGSGPVPQNQITLTNISTLLLQDGTNLLTGFDADDASISTEPRSSPNSLGAGRRSLDTEGFARTSDGGFYICDEYGPFIYRFNSNGVLQFTLVPPAAVLPKRGAYPGTNVFTGASAPTSGRRNNRGLEGLSLSPDEKKLFTMLQSPLIQDGGSGSSGRNTRLFVFDIAPDSPTFGKPIAEYIYQLTLNGNAQTNRNTPISEVMALNHEQLLVIERDNLGLGSDDTASPIYKTVVLADLSRATNIINTGYDLERGAPGQTSLPAGTLPSNIAPVVRTNFISLIDTNELTKFGLNIRTNQDANTLSEKWEGLALLPLHDPAAPNDFLLLVGNDNDFKAAKVYHNGVVVGTNTVTVDSMLLAYHVTLPNVGAAPPPNRPPSVVITGPTNATLSAPAAAIVPASAYDQDGLVTKVEFFRGETKLGESSAFPFSLALADLAPGQYEITAVATDHQGATNRSPVKTIVVTSENLPPLITLSGPTNAALSAPAELLLTASADDPDGSVTKVEFFDGNAKLGEDVTPPYQLTLTNVATGTHEYLALATDNHGATNRSGKFVLNVTSENLLPTVSLESPTNGIVLTAPINLTLVARAEDADGKIAKIEFYRGTTKLGEDKTAPYSLVVTNPLVGSFVFSAVAIDNHGAQQRSSEVNVTVQRAASDPLILQVLHASDFEVRTDSLDDPMRFSSVLAALRAEYPTNTITLSSGNSFIPGPFYNASAERGAPFNGVKGRGDIAIMNGFGIQAAALGNDEFDEGTSQLRDLLLADGTVAYAGTRFPFLSANLDFSHDLNLSNLVTADGQDWTKATNRIARSSIIAVAGQKIGVIGATSPELRFISSPGPNIGIETNLVREIQTAVDALLAQGLNKIVVLANLRQITNEFALATQLRDVDLIVAGGSQTLLAKQTERLREGDTRQGDYPMAFTSASGEPVYVVNTAGEYRYVGRLLVAFNTNGVATAVESKSGVYATDAQGVLDSGGLLPEPSVAAVVDTLSAIIDAKDKNRFGRTAEYLNGLYGEVRTEETNLGDLTADANLARARRVDSSTVISIKNAGALGGSIGAMALHNGILQRQPPLGNPHVGKSAGEISQLDIEAALRFNDGLMLLTVTAQQLRDTMEWAIAGSGTPGQFPQVSGLAFSFDPSREPMTYQRDSNNVPNGIATPGERLRSLVVTRPDHSSDLVVENGKLIGDPNRPFRLVTLDFLAHGGDSYYALTLGKDQLDLIDTNVAARSFTTDGAEQKALADYLAKIGRYDQPDRAAIEDHRLQNLSVRADTVLAPEILKLQFIVSPPFADGVSLNFTTLPGKRYQADVRNDLNSAWTVATPEIISGDGTVKAITIPQGLFYPQRFYRLRMLD